MASPFITSQCIICGVGARTMERYPRIACRACHRRAVNAAGERIRFYTPYIAGGFEARLVDEAQTLDDEVTRTNLVYIDGQAVFADEARFGGSVIQPLEDRPDPARKLPPERQHELPPDLLRELP
ncbi:hypothetical protein CLV30_101109 [Haloactinopolyspora alba]|uniref:Uncharacterized protein n=1 Tax=Haloactinopolyspora alba TaxID=648780 RepID=A0A2P8EF89_9ACTN|nr:hypothetical protein [Haloactinopolyspora alba]PSL08142.1 hypothetical protein CLV30_101109 [Haloactinopolyspora alba]